MSFGSNAQDAHGDLFTDVDHLEAALFGDDAEERNCAAATMHSLLARIRVRSPELFRVILTGSLHTANGGELAPSGGARAEIFRAINLLNNGDSSAIVYLLRAVNPRWLTGGEFYGDAPAVRELAEPLLSFIDRDQTEFSSFAAIVLGRYGLEALSVLPELIRRLRRYRTDCHRAAGLAWAVYQIGGLSVTVEDVFYDLASQPDTCPRTMRFVRRIMDLHGLLE